METLKKFELHITDTGKQISIRRKGAPITERTSLCQIFIYHDVATMWGIQGEDFFRAIHENLDTMFSLANVYCGYVWDHHVDLYRHIGLNVEVLRKSELEGFPISYIWVTR